MLVLQAKVACPKESITNNHLAMVVKELHSTPAGVLQDSRQVRKSQRQEGKKASRLNQQNFVIPEMHVQSSRQYKDVVLSARRVCMYQAETN